MHGDEHVGALPAAVTAGRLAQPVEHYLRKNERWDVWMAVRFEVDLTAVSNSI